MLQSEFSGITIDGGKSYGEKYFASFPERRKDKKS